MIPTLQPPNTGALVSFVLWCLYSFDVVNIYVDHVAAITHACRGFHKLLLSFKSLTLWSLKEWEEFLLIVVKQL